MFDFFSIFQCNLLAISYVSFCFAHMTICAIVRRCDCAPRLVPTFPAKFNDHIRGKVGMEATQFVDRECNFSQTVSAARYFQALKPLLLPKTCGTTQYKPRYTAYEDLMLRLTHTPPSCMYTPCSPQFPIFKSRLLSPCSCLRCRTVNSQLRAFSSEPDMKRGVFNAPATAPRSLGRSATIKASDSQ